MMVEGWLNDSGRTATCQWNDLDMIMEGLLYDSGWTVI
jgi:hypothetical protein